MRTVAASRGTTRVRKANTVAGTEKKQARLAGCAEFAIVVFIGSFASETLHGHFGPLSWASDARLPLDPFPQRPGSGWPFMCPKRLSGTVCTGSFEDYFTTHERG